MIALPSNEGHLAVTGRAAAEAEHLIDSACRRYGMQIGPSSVALEGQFDPYRWPIDVAHYRFARPIERPQLTLIAHHGPPRAPRGQLVFQAGGVASFYRDGSSWEFRLGESEDASSVDRILTLEPSGNLGILVMNVDQSPTHIESYPLQYPLEDFLFRHLFADRAALLVHACGIVWQGRGYLFVGSSGSGKSTTARLWKAAGATVLNDDRIVLEARQAGALIHPTPWFGEHPDVGTEAAPLAGLYLLRKGPNVILDPIRPGNAAALLFAKSFPPLWDSERMARTLETLDHVCRHVPCAWLTVPPDPRAVAWVQAHR